jgi:uroporphyrinogen-III decarboxylase
LNSRDRVLGALERRTVDRIPIDFWATASVIRRLEAQRGTPHATFLDDYDVDLRYIEGPAYVGLPLAPGTDIWGVARAGVAVGAAGRSESYSEAIKAPLGDAEEPDYIALIKRHGALAMHHTCGAVAEIIPDMIECGLDVLQSIQPEAEGMSLAALKRRFGTQLSFHGGVSIQRTMPYGSVADVRREVAALAAVAKPDGGYVFCTSHNIQADTPVESIIALMEAYLEYGRY